MAINLFSEASSSAETRTATPPVLAWSNISLNPSSHYWTNATAIGKDGEIYLCGVSLDGLDGSKYDSLDSFDAFLIKISADGSKVWTRLIGEPSQFDSASAITVDTRGFVYILGGTQNNGGSGRFLAKFDSYGNKVWYKSLNHLALDSGQSASIVVGENNSLYILSSADGTTSLEKYNINGIRLWSQALCSPPQPSNNTNYSGFFNSQLIAGDDGFIYVAGNSERHLQGRDGCSGIVLSKINEEGGTVWTRLYEPEQFSVVRGLNIGSDGSIFVFGEVSGDAFFNKYSPDGSESFSKTLASTQFDSANGLFPTKDGSIYLLGKTAGGGEIGDFDSTFYAHAGSDTFLAKYNASGDKEWTRLISALEPNLMYSDSFGVLNLIDESILVVANSNWGSVFSKLLLTGNFNNLPTGAPTLSGTFKAGQVISIDEAPIYDADNFLEYTPTYSYKWEVSADGATWNSLTNADATDNNSTYTLTTSEVGKKVRGVVSYLDGYGTNESVPSNGSSLIQAAINLDIGSTSTTASKTTTLASTISRLTLTGTSNINAIGNALNNYLTGNNGNNILDGGVGNDILAGGRGNDTYIVDSIYDSIVENINEGIEIIQSSVNWILGANLENLTLTGTGNLFGTGNGLNNTIIGNSGNNVIDGGSGIDTLDGGLGNDTLIGGLGNDVLRGGAGDDIYSVDSIGDIITEVSGTDTVMSAISWTLGSNLENLTLTGTDAIRGIGNTLNNTIIGNDGNNVLDGLVGRDILTGGLRADTFRFSTKPSFGASSADHITDFNAAEGDKLQISKSAFGLASNATASLTTVNSASALTTALGSTTTFVYDSSNGNLYWNQNGNKSGFGTGGIFAVLDNKSALTSSNISLF